MAKKYEITTENIAELQSARKNNRDKKIDRWLYALILHAEGHKGKYIAEVTGFSRQYLYELYRKYLTKGINGIIESHYGGNRRNMTLDEETAFLEQFIDDADGGHITCGSALRYYLQSFQGNHSKHYWTQLDPVVF